MASSMLQESAGGRFPGFSNHMVWRCAGHPERKEPHRKTAFRGHDYPQMQLWHLGMDTHPSFSTQMYSNCDPHAKIQNRLWRSRQKYHFWKDFK